MAKKHIKRRGHQKAATASLRRVKPAEHYLVAVRGWMLVVAFALMLGIGAIVGNFINQQLDATTPSVAGASTSR